VFAELDKNGNMSKSIAINGVLCILVAIFVDFSYLNDLISAGILVSFNLSNCALIQIRRQNPTNPTTTKYYLVAFNLIAIFTASLYANADLGNNAVLFFIALGLFCVFMIPFIVFYYCPEVPDPDAAGQYRVPLMPFFPFFAMFINYVLLSFLTAFGAYLFIAYSGSAVVFYYVYGVHYSVGNNSGWKEKLDAYKVIQQQQEENRLKDLENLEKHDGFHSKDHEGILQVQVDDMTNEISGIKVAI
jgi:basic amino acid/polyamine antiporter, APA family